MQSARVLAVTLLGIGMLGYVAWVLEFFLPTGLSPIHIRVENLYLEGQRFGPLFKYVQIVAGGALILSGLPLMRLSPLHWLARLTAATVALLGVTVVAGALFPQSPWVTLLTNLVFVIGEASLALWWPPGWRASAFIGLLLVLATWLGVLLLESLGSGQYVGLVTRLQMVLRAVLLGIGAAYLFRDRHMVSAHGRSADFAGG
ncbi:hypothetical protein [Amycolatopsis sp. NPDC059657]|uniref:hypothetical protein n=1 Tax=Amycolatopsis sp. NPDC059657 TaxID=3346899 RepID=UPI0036729B42